MIKTEQDARRWVTVGVVALLLLGFAGCVKTLEHEARPLLPEPAALAGPLGGGGPLDESPTTAAQEAKASAPQEAKASAPPIAPVFIAPLEDVLRVHEILLTERDGERAIVVRLSRPPDDVRHFTLRSPDRVIVDLTGPLAPGERPRTHLTSDPEIETVRVAAHEGKLRIVADLLEPVVDYRVEPEERSVTMLLGPALEPVGTQVLYLTPGVDHFFAEVHRAPEETPPGAAAGSSPEAGAEAVASQPQSDAADASASTAPAAASPHGSAQTSEPEARALAPDPVPARPLESEDDETYEPAVFERPSTYALPVVEGESGSRASSTTKLIEDGSVEILASEPREYTGQRISLDFKDADVQNVLRILAEVSGLNIITTEDVEGRLTMRLVDVPWDQALDAILKAKGLDMVRDGNIIRVSTVEQMKKEHEARRAADEAQRQVEPLRVHYVKVNYAKADESLVKKVREVLTERGTATWDERTNTVVVRDIARGIADAEELIAQFDTQTPQVLIEANIVEATEALIRDLGIQWGYTYRASPETGNAPGVNFPGRVDGGGVLAGGENSPAGKLPFIADFPAAVAPGAGAAYDLFLGSLDGSSTLNARLTALERQGKGKIISRPRVVTLNNVPAKIASLEILRVRLPSTGTVISTGAGGSAGTAQSATEKIETGIVLQVTPQVSSDGFIFLDVYAKSSTASRERSTDNIPNEVSREANSHVLIKNGETFVLGGVFRNELNKVDAGIPYLRSIPVLGWLFKNNLNDDSRQELLVFVTPRTTRARGTENLANLPSAENLWHNRVDR